MPYSARLLQTPGKEGWRQKGSLPGAPRPGQIKAAPPNTPARDRKETKVLGDAAWESRKPQPFLPSLLHHHTLSYLLSPVVAHHYQSSPLIYD